MSNITLQQIETFLVVAEHLNFTEAAKAMYISQPALSKTVSRLEKGIDTKLFQRSTHGVRLTKEGEYLYSELRPLYNKFFRTFQDVQDKFCSKKKTVTIGCHTSYVMSDAFTDLKEIVRSFEETHPEVIVLEEMFDFRELRNSLLSGEVDVIFSASFALEDIMNISRKLTKVIDLYIVMSAFHPLASHETLDYNELNNQVFYFVSSNDTQSRANTDMLRCNQIGFTPRSIQYLPNFNSVLRAVRQGKGMALIGQNSDRYSPDLKSFPTSNIPDPPHVVVAWRTGDVSGEAKELIDMIPGL